LPASGRADMDGRSSERKACTMATGRVPLPRRSPIGAGAVEPVGAHLETTVFFVRAAVSPPASGGSATWRVAAGLRAGVRHCGSALAAVRLVPDSSLQPTPVAGASGWSHQPPARTRATDSFHLSRQMFWNSSCRRGAAAACTASSSNANHRAQRHGPGYSSFSAEPGSPRRV
jgi:hypothetical protein